ncbi:MAG: hypothetical protein JW902_12245 [Syntrophaceae bacterium]|nr:hypothetical protein [Syntrophaceae bacterium]
MDKLVPVLKGYNSDQSIHVWCPFCMKWHIHGLTPDLKKGKRSHRVSDCPFYEHGYYVQLFTKKELKEIVISADLRQK